MLQDMVDDEKGPHHRLAEGRIEFAFRFGWKPNAHGSVKGSDAVIINELGCAIQYFNLEIEHAKTVKAIQIVVLLNGELWPDASPSLRRYWIDHALAMVDPKSDSDGVAQTDAYGRQIYRKLPPEAAFFSSVLSRHGLVDSDVRAFMRRATSGEKQLSLFVNELREIGSTVTSSGARSVTVTFGAEPGEPVNPAPPPVYYYAVRDDLFRGEVWALRFATADMRSTMLNGAVPLVLGTRAQDLSIETLEILDYDVDEALLGRIKRRMDQQAEASVANVRAFMQRKDEPPAEIDIPAPDGFEGEEEAVVG